MPNDLLFTPGRISPASNKDLTTRITDYNTLKYASLAHPEILNALGMYYMEQNDGIDAMIAHFGGYGDAKGLDSNIKLLGNHEFAWRMHNSTQKMYRFTRDPEGMQVNGKLGVGGKHFVVYINRDVMTTDEVFQTSNFSHQFMIRKITPTGRNIDGGREVRCEVRYMLTAGIAGDGMPVALVSQGAETQRGYNLKAEWSRHGSSDSITSGDWMQGSMSTLRTEYKMSGNAYHTKTQDEWVHYTDNEGKVFTYNVTGVQKLTLQLLHKQASHLTLMGKKAVNADGSFLRDDFGQYFSGDGIYHQNKKKQKVPYVKINTQLLNQIERSIDSDTNGLIQGKPRISVCGGIGFRQEFSNYLAKVFTNTNAMPLYYQEGTQQGVKSDFTIYETPVAQFVVKGSDFFNDKFWPSTRSANGFRENQDRAFLMNVSELKGGKPNMQLLAQSGRQNVSGQINGMANGGAMATPVDGFEEHFLTTRGVAVSTPSCIYELYKK